MANISHSLGMLHICIVSVWQLCVCVTKPCGIVFVGSGFMHENLEVDENWKDKLVYNLLSSELQFIRHIKVFFLFFVALGSQAIQDLSCHDMQRSPKKTITSMRGPTVYHSLTPMLLLLPFLDVHMWWKILVFYSIK